MNVASHQSIYFAVGDEALKNGSFYFRDEETLFARYILGDFDGYYQTIPEGLIGYSKSAAKQILPKYLF